MKPSAKVPLLNSEEVYNVLSAALVGTSFMTAFSYVISEKEKKFFKEPELLNLLLKRIYSASILLLLLSGSALCRNMKEGSPLPVLSSHRLIKKAEQRITTLMI